MVFNDFASAWLGLLLAGCLIAFILGFIANKTHFCTMGAVSDWVNLNHTGRMRSWLLTIAVTLAGVTTLEYFGITNFNTTYPPYRNGQLIWAENILGGILFGIGMTLAGGCGNKCLVRLGAGNLKSLLVFLLIGVIAYFMLNPFPNSDQTLYSLLFYPWLHPLALNLGASQDLGALVADEAHTDGMRLILGSLIAIILLFIVVLSADFRSSKDFALGGLGVGLCVLAAWYASSQIKLDVDGQIYSLSQYYAEWDLLAESDSGKPASSAPLSTQSFTFINPIGQSIAYLASGLQAKLLTFGILACLGVILGSLTWALISRSFKFEWFASIGDFFNHLIGATLMGLGGVLAMGCTIGQGITGVSTLALGSILTLTSIIFASALTMKIQFYRMMYEREANFFKALSSSLVDLKLLPESMRRLKKV